MFYNAHTMRRLFTALIVLLAVAFIGSQWDELQQVFASLQRGDLLWLALAILVQLMWLVSTALTYQAIYRLLGMSASLKELFPLVVTSNFVNVATPSGGMGGLAVFIGDARRHQRSTARVTIAGVLFILFDYFGFLCVLALGLLVLFRRNHLNVAEVTAAIILFIVALALAAIITLGIRAPQLLERVLRWGARTVNRLLFPLRHRPYLSEDRAHEFAIEAAEGLHELRTDWREYLLPAAYSLAGKALLITILFLTFLAFNQPFSVGTLIAGFSMAFLFMIVSPTPAGVGFVETVMPAALTALGVPAGAALIIALAYRGLTFWLPFLYGFIALRVLQRRWEQAVELRD